MAIHPTAVLMGDVELGDDVEIGPFVVIRGPVKIGAGTIIQERASIKGTTVIGVKNWIGVGAVIGEDPQDLSYKGQSSQLEIGDRNTFREYVTVHRGASEGSATTVGNDNMIMGLSHVGHDCHIRNHIVIANCVVLAGHVELFDRVFISGLVGVHQFARLGRCCMVAGLSRVSKDVPPFMTALGESSILGLNAVGMRRAGIPTASRDALHRAFRVLYRSPLTVSEAVEELARNPEVPEVEELAEFVRQSKRGIAAYRRVSNISGDAYRAGSY